MQKRISNFAEGVQITLDFSFFEPLSLETNLVIYWHYGQLSPQQGYVHNRPSSATFYPIFIRGTFNPSRGGILTQVLLLRRTRLFITATPPLHFLDKILFCLLRNFLLRSPEKLEHFSGYESRKKKDRYARAVVITLSNNCQYWINRHQSEICRFRKFRKKRDNSKVTCLHSDLGVCQSLRSLFRRRHLTVKLGGFSRTKCLCRRFQERKMVVAIVYKDPC